MAYSGGGGTRGHVESVACARTTITGQVPGVMEQGHVVTSEEYVPLQKQLLEFLLGPGRERMPVHGTPSDHALGKYIMS